ncbi:MAG TPA: hypothetical protein VFQ53_11365 [Kofleriaceae bacterium]|nr:hypothetical protein [Kofleriaceae bacterium]
MRLTYFFFAFSLALTACKSDERHEDLCERASDNARRLVLEDPTAKSTYGEDPLTLAHCRDANLSAEIKQCVGYASSWAELRACDPNLIVPAHNIGRR